MLRSFIVSYKTLCIMRYIRKYPSIILLCITVHNYAFCIGL